MKKDKIEEISDLVALLKDGAITQEEFNELKTKIISSDDKSSSVNNVSEEPVKKNPVSRNRKKKNEAEKFDVPFNPFLGNKVEIKYEKYAQYIIKFTLALIIIMSIFSGLKNDSFTTFFVILTIFGFAYFITYKLFIRVYSKIKSAIILTIIPIFVSIAIFSPNGPAEPSSSSQSTDFSNSKYCSKHDRMYDPNNAWKGCPQCVEEQDIKNTEKAREKFRHL